MATPKAGWPGPRSAARDRTREAILAAALRLFAERGYIGTRVEDVAKEAGVSRATFYKHFAERDQVLEHLFGQLLGGPDDVVSSVEGDWDGRVLDLLGATASKMVGNELLARFVYSIPIRHDAVLPGGAAVPGVFEQVRGVLEEARDAGAVRGDVSLDRAMEVLGRAFESAMREWAEGRTEDPRTALRELLDIGFRGLATDDGGPGATR